MDNFSDDGFDDLNDNILQELENNAIQFTQANTLHPTQAAPATQNYGLGDDDLDDTVVIDELAQKPARPAAAADRPLPPQQPRPLPPTFAGQQRWSQQGHQSNAPYHAQQQYPPQGRVIPSARPHPAASQRFPVRPGPQSRLPPPALRPHVLQLSQVPGSADVDGGDDIVNALKARLAALQSELNSAKGEASILRNKYDKSLASHDAEVARLRKQNADQLAQKERLVEAAVAAERNAATELEFTRQDLKEELGRSKSKKKDSATTPKKNKKWSAGDGFDDIEILPSPSKGQGQRRRDTGPVATSVTERTPSKGKRKRPMFDSPINALETHSDDFVMVNSDPAKSSHPAKIDPVKADAFHDFHKLVMAHGSLHGQPLTFDVFARYAIPSDPTQSFASILIQELACVSDSKKPVDLLVDFCTLILDLWARSLAEQYYSPMYDLAALIFFTLQLNTTGVAPRIIASLLPLVQDTCYFVVEARFRGQTGDISSDVDVTQSLSVMYLSALGCLGPPVDEAPAGTGDEGPPAQIDVRAEFWKFISLEFIKMMLCTSQHEPDFLGVLSLLCTSVFPNSIGPIPQPSASTDQLATGNTAFYTPETIGKAIVNQVSLHLTSPFLWAAPGSAKLCEVRLAVLKTLQAFASSPFGALLIASSPIAIPRLVTLLSWAIDRLYDMDVPATGWDVRSLLERNRDAVNSERHQEKGVPDAEDPESTQPMDVDSEVQKGEQEPVNPPAPGPTLPPGRSINPNLEPDLTPLLFRIVSQTTLLLHTLITNPRTSNVANIATKLATSHGGSQRYQLMLARLNFAEEDLVLEAGVDSETMELAHELLELFVTPEDGEAVGEVFGA